MSCYRTCPHCGAHIDPESAVHAGPPPPHFEEQRAQGDRREEYHFPLCGRIPPSTSASNLRSAADTTRPPAHTHIPLNGFYPLPQKTALLERPPPSGHFPPLLLLGGWGEAQKRIWQHSAAGPHWVRPPCKVPAGQRPGQDTTAHQLEDAPLRFRPQLFEYMIHPIQGEGEIYRPATLHAHSPRYCCSGLPILNRSLPASHC